jgi:hypothetical protein
MVGTCQGGANRSEDGGRSFIVTSCGSEAGSCPGTLVVTSQTSRVDVQTKAGEILADKPYKPYRVN